MDINSTFSSYPELASATSSSAQTLSSINVLSFVSTEIELPPLKEMMNHSGKSMIATESNLFPQFMEPTPIFENVSTKSRFVPRIFSTVNSKGVLSSASSCTSNSSNPPSPLASTCLHLDASLLPTVQPRLSFNNKSSKCPYSSKNKQWPKENPVDEAGHPMSPTMMAASAIATAAATDSHVADTFLSARPGSLDSRSEYASAVSPMLNESEQASFARVSFIVHGPKYDNTSSGIERHMLLTKNAHIKRPRNAWIYFRCHYGQALKRQHPTLRAEEISKRASRRWSLISENEKKPWHDLAEQEKQAHKAAFPEYKYCPRRSLLAKRKSFVDAQNHCSKANSLYNDSIDDDIEKRAKRRLMMMD